MCIPVLSSVVGRRSSVVGRPERVALLVLVVNLLVALFCAAPAHAQLSNPGFESPKVATFQTFNPGQVLGSGWVVESTTTFVDILNAAYPGDANTKWYPPSEGSQFLFLADTSGVSTLTQNVALSQGNYKLSFDLADVASRQSGSNGARLNVDIVSTPSQSSLIGGTQVFSRPAFGDFQTFSIDFTTPSTDNYQIRLTSQQGYSSNVDNFRLNPSTTAAPEASPLAVGGGVGTLALRRRKAVR